MNTSLGYAKKTLTNSNVLLSGGGDKALSEFIGSLNWDSTNKKLQYKSASSTDFTDLITFGSNAFTSYSGYDIVFLNNAGTTVDTFKALTSPSKTLKAGTNVQMTADSNVITITATDTWNANAVGVAGYVAAPTKTDNANMTWLTDANGNPAWRTSNNHSHAYLPLSGGTMNLGEGLKFHSDENYFGTNLDARIISLLDGNGTTCDGGLIIDERATNNGTVTVTELLRIRDNEFKWKGLTIYHSGNLPAYPTKASWNYDDVYLKLSGGTLTGTLTMKTNGSGSYNQGIRINRINTSSWALLLIGKSGNATSGTGTATAGDGAWLIGTPASSNSLIFNLNDANESKGLCLKGHGINDMKWNNNTVYHAGNLPAYPTKASWNYDDIYVKSVSISGDNLRINKNGTDSDLTIPYASKAEYANKVLGSYTYNGGQQNPNYFGTNRVGFLMMNTTVNENSQYKDWIIMDCYNNNDVGGGVAIGVNRQSLGAYIMRSAAARTSWAESAELIGTHNYTTYCATAGHSHTLGIEADSGTSSITLSANTTYKLTAGGSTYVFTSTPDENVKQTPKTDNVNRPLMMINGDTSAVEQTNTSTFSTGIYANASTKMITASGFIKADSSDSYVLLGGGGHAPLKNLQVAGTATSVTSLNVGLTFIYATLTENATLGLSAEMSVGQVLTILAFNNGSTSITLTVPSAWKSLDGYSINIGALKFGEISILCYANGNYMVSSKIQ